MYVQKLFTMKTYSIRALLILLVIATACNFGNKADEIANSSESDSISQLESANKSAVKKPTETKGEMAVRNFELKKLIFFGTEPFWDMKFKTDFAEYSNSDGTYLKLSYSPKADAQSTLPDAVKMLSENELQITTYENGKKLQITIKKESCSDGMSDESYAYSISLAWESDNNTLFGCGRVINIETEKDRFEEELWTRINSLQEDYKIQTLVYETDIRNFDFYKKDAYFKSYVDYLFDLGYNVTHEKGQYYLKTN